jgi:hypothetical protein
MYYGAIYIQIHRDVFGRMPLLLGNRQLNTSMESRNSPTIAHGYIATKNRRPQQHEGQPVFLLGQLGVV